MVLDHGPMLTAYLDETGSDADTDTLWIAGYLADSISWFEFGRAWRRMLAEHGIPALHMREYTASQGAFQGWTPDQKRRLLTDAIDIINSLDLYGIAMGADKSAFAEAVRDGAGKIAVAIEGEPARDPYLWAFQDVVIEFANQADHLNRSERIAFVFDRHPHLRAASERIYAALATNALWPRHARLGSLHFEISATTPPLQAADLLAYEIRRERNRILSSAQAAPRVSLSRLRKRLWAARYWDRAHLNQIIEESRGPTTGCTGRAARAGEPYG